MVDVIKGKVNCQGKVYGTVPSCLNSKATFTLHRYSFRPLHFCYGSSASTLYRIKTVPLPFPVYTVLDPFDFLLRACAQQVSHCMQGRKFALKSHQNIFNVCLRRRRQLEYIPHIELQCTRCESVLVLLRFQASTLRRSALDLYRIKNSPLS